MKTTNLFNKNKKGVTLIEALLVLAIGAVIIGGVLTMYSGSSNKNATTQALSNITEFKSNIENRYKENIISDEGLDNTIAIQGGLVPSQYTQNAATGTIVNEFEGSITVGVVNTNGFYFEYTKIPSKKPCSDLVSKFKKQFTSITVNSTAVAANATQTAIATVCGVGEEATIRFTQDNS